MANIVIGGNSLDAIRTMGFEYSQEIDRSGLYTKVTHVAKGKWDGYPYTVKDKSLHALAASLAVVLMEHDRDAAMGC